MNFKNFRAVTIGILIGIVLLAGCIGVPEPLPLPRTFLSPLGVQYLPLAARPGTFGRGGALTYSAIAGCEDARKLGATWAYNWTADGPQCPGIASLPMTWERVYGVCPELGPGNPILLWNEPSSAGITPDEAVYLTRYITTGCYPGRQFATPAEFGGQGGADTTVWLTEWWNAYTVKYGPPPVSIMATHCYAGDAATCITSLSRDIAWANERNLHVLITEWGVVPRWAGSTERAMSEADILLHWIQKQPEIIGEAFFSTRQTGAEVWWFKGPTTATVDMATGELTAWGRWYAAH
jgi:hypothetical protein